MITVHRIFHISAAHALPLVADGHKCKRMHGHNYRVEVHVRGELTDGMVIDFAEIDRAWERVHAALDHRTLNDVIANPTAENIAEWIAGQLTDLGPRKIVVWENDRCGATWEADHV